MITIDIFFFLVELEMLNMCITEKLPLFEIFRSLTCKNYRYIITRHAELRLCHGVCLWGRILRQVESWRNIASTYLRFSHGAIERSFCETKLNILNWTIHHGHLTSCFVTFGLRFCRRIKVSLERRFFSVSFFNDCSLFLAVNPISFPLPTPSSVPLPLP